MANPPQAEPENTMKSLYSYPVEIESEEQEVYVVVTDAEAYRPADRYGPEEGGVYTWHLSRTEYGDYDETIVATEREIDLIDKYMTDDINERYYA
jgi:hypothetical protein